MGWNHQLEKVTPQKNLQPTIHLAFGGHSESTCQGVNCLAGRHWLPRRSGVTRPQTKGAMWFLQWHFFEHFFQVSISSETLKAYPSKGTNISRIKMAFWSRWFSELPVRWDMYPFPESLPFVFTRFSLRVCYACGRCWYTEVAVSQFPKLNSCGGTEYNCMVCFLHYID